MLPSEYHEQFQAEYYVAAAEAARRIDGYRRLHTLLRLWRLRAADELIPGWTGRRPHR